MFGGYSIGSAAIASTVMTTEGEAPEGRQTKNSRQTMNVMPGVHFQIICENM